MAAKNHRVPINMHTTERLFLHPLTYGQLLKYAANDYSLETELNLLPVSRQISSELREALDQTLLPQLKNATTSYMYHTLWTGILKDARVMVGEVCFAGPPDEQGQVEIGYGTHDKFQGKGYMTEMVACIINWLRTQPQVKTILASTDKINVASSRVLQKNGFTQAGETDDQWQWVLNLGGE